MKVVVLDFDRTIIQQDLYPLLTTANKLPYAYTARIKGALLSSSDDNSSYLNQSYDAMTMQKLIDKLLDDHELTTIDAQAFKINIDQLKKQGLFIAVATRTSRIDVIDYILQKFLGEEHNIIIVGGGGQSAEDKGLHIEKIIQIIQTNYHQSFKASETILIDNNLEVIKNSMNKSKDHCSGINIKPDHINDGLELLQHYIKTAETYMEDKY